MTKLKTNFFGLELKNPFIVASSGLTRSISNIKSFAENGASAIVLKSIFEEEVYAEYEEIIRKQGNAHHYQEHLDYFDYEIKENNLKEYLQLIKDAKAAVDIPIIASINCISNGDWVQFASRIEEANADAIELNLFLLPSDVNRTAEDNYRFYINTVRSVIDKVKIPVSVKISSYFSDLGCVIKDLNQIGVAGISMFNRFYTPDINIDTESLQAASVLSENNEYHLPLRWIGLMADKVNCELAATTGIHDAETAIKLILAGADAVQMASVFYTKGIEYLPVIIAETEKWMNIKGYHSLASFKGKLSFTQAPNPGWYERVQFMTYFGEYNA